MHFLTAIKREMGEGGRVEFAWFKKKSLHDSLLLFSIAEKVFRAHIFFFLLGFPRRKYLNVFPRLNARTVSERPKGTADSLEAIYYIAMLKYFNISRWCHGKTMRPTNETIEIKIVQLGSTCVHVKYKYMHRTGTNGKPAKEQTHYLMETHSCKNGT